MTRVSTSARGPISAASAFWPVFSAFAVAGVLTFEAGPASARGLFPWSEDEPPRTEEARVWKRSPQPRPRIARKTLGHRGFKAADTPPSSEAKAPEAPIRRPLFLIVSIADQRVSVYNHDGVVVSSRVSTGMAGHLTPRGVFTIIGRERYHRSNIYSGAPMPFMQRVTWSGIAMHLGVVPSYPASHGCIRLPAAFAPQLWGLTRIGERIVISPQDTAPVEFAHPLLPAPKMLARVAANDTGAAASSPPAMLNPLQYAEQIKVKATAEAAAAAKAVKENLAVIAPKQQEAAVAAAELRRAETAQAVAQAKAAAAARVYDAAAASVCSRRQGAAFDLSALQAVAAPGGFAHVWALRALKAQEAAAAAKAGADAGLAEAAAKLETAKTASATKATELADALRRWNDAKAAFGAAEKAAKEAARRSQPVSVLVSKKDQRIYVRQGLAPVFDAPASVRDPDTPLGTHLYIATAAKDDGTSLKWSVVSMPGQAAEPPNWRAKKKGGGEATEPPARRPASGPAEALERVDIAQDIRDRVAELLWTGGSLIVSDQPLSGETGKDVVGADLTVKTR